MVFGLNKVEDKEVEEAELVKCPLCSGRPTIFILRSLNESDETKFTSSQRLPWRAIPFFLSFTPFLLIAFPFFLSSLLFVDTLIQFSLSPPYGGNLSFLYGSLLVTSLSDILALTIPFLNCQILYHLPLLHIVVTKCIHMEIFNLNMVVSLQY